MPIRPTEAQKQTFDRLFFCVGEAINEGCDWAEANEPGTRERIQQMLGAGFVARVTIERTPALQFTLELIGEDQNRGPVCAEVFRYQMDDGRAGLH